MPFTEKDVKEEALARVILGFGPNEHISRQKLNRKRINLTISWHPKRDSKEEAIRSKVIKLVDRCYKVLLPKAKDLPEPKTVIYVGDLLQEHPRPVILRISVALAFGTVLLLIL